MESTTPGVQIYEWTPEVFGWRDECGDVGRFLRESMAVSVWTDTEVVVPVEELVAWLGGEGPPEPPIQVGDRVQWRSHPGHGRVVAIDGDRLAVIWDDGCRGWPDREYCERVSDE